MLWDNLSCGLIKSSLKRGREAVYLATMDNDWVYIEKDDAHVARERKKARELKNSNWWRTLVSKGVCEYCGKHVAPSELTMDHKIPVARGGRSTKGNIAACCPECNKSKKCLTPAEIILNAMPELPPEEGDESC